MLIIFGGLPGTGKTTISKEVARRLKAVYLRVDTIEQTLKNLEGYPDSLIIGSEGYVISYAIAKENLSLGLDVIADSVNPIAITRHDWRQVAKEANTVYVEIELICSDKTEHQGRVEGRVADISGHKLPTWKDVLNRDYEPWESISMVVDTSRHTVNESVQKIIEHIKWEALYSKSGKIFTELTPERLRQITTDMIDKLRADLQFDEIRTLIGPSRQNPGRPS